MGITGLIPFLEKASRKTNVDEFSGSTVAIDSYCWLHKGAFACADKLVRGETTDIHIKYCLKYVTMLLSKNIKPILVFDGRHLPAKAMTESKRRESRDISKKRAAELLSLGKIDEARSYMRRSVDITHAMALALIKECRKRNVDCIVAPYEADAQLAYLNIKNIAHLVITEDSDLILFGCTKVLFKMDLDGSGTLVETAKLPLVMRCPIEHYSFDKFRQMCIMSGCDYLASLPGIGLAKARQFVSATQDSNFANALRKLPSFFNKSSLVVSDEYRESFLKAEATFKHQYVYDPLERKMVRLTDPDDEDVEQALCVNAGEMLDAQTAFQLALGNLDPFSLRKMDDWHPDTSVPDGNVKTSNWKEKAVSSHPSIWRSDYTPYLTDPSPWTKKVKKVEPIIGAPLTRPKKKVVNMVVKCVPETQDESLTIESLSSMYCTGPPSKKQKMNCDKQSETYTQDTQNEHNIAQIEDEIVKELPSTQRSQSPILENKDRSFKKSLNSYSVLKRLSKFPRTVLGDNVVESKFFNTSKCDKSTSNNRSNLDTSRTSVVIEESPEKESRNPFKMKSPQMKSSVIDTQCVEIPDSQIEGNNLLMVKTEESPDKVSRNPFKLKSPDNNRTLLIDTQCVEIPDSQTERKNLYKVKSECNGRLEIDTQCVEIPDSQLNSSQKENSPQNSPVKRKKSPILSSQKVKNTLKVRMDLVQRVCDKLSEDSVIDNTYPLEELVTPVDSQGLSKEYVKAESCYDSPSDHTPVILTVSSGLIETMKPITLYNKNTDWEAFGQYITDNIQMKVALKTADDIDEATEYITRLIQESCWLNTPWQTSKSMATDYPAEIKKAVLERRRLRRVWQLTRLDQDKKDFHIASKQLKEILADWHNKTLSARLESLTPSPQTNYSLWKFTKNYDRPQPTIPPLRYNNVWARTPQEKADSFADHLSQVFNPNPSNDSETDNMVDTVLLQDYQMSILPRLVTVHETWQTIRSLKDKKAPGFDLITKEVLRRLPRKAVVFLTTLFNCIIRAQHFPQQWKISQILMIHKVGKPLHEVSSYRPISLLPILSKVFEKLLLHRIKLLLDKDNIIPSHQFGFRPQHSTVEQVHRVCDRIRKSLEEKEYCSSAFLDIHQAFDRVWHRGLLYKIKTYLPHSYVELMKSYLSDRLFQVRVTDVTSKLLEINAGVPQGSVLGPVLYTIYTADLPVIDGVTTATYADDTAILASSADPVVASEMLQRGLDRVSLWLNKWRIKASATKSVHVTFALRSGDCPSIQLDQTTLPHADRVKYLGMHLDRRLTWKNHVKSKRDELNIRYKNLYWLIGRNSLLSIDNKLLIYKAMLKPVWTYGIQLWGSCSNSNILILQRMQNIILRSLCNVPWPVTNAEIHKELQMLTVKEEIASSVEKYKGRLEVHPNELAAQLKTRTYHKRLKRKDILSS